MYIHLDIPKQFCCSLYNDKRVFEIEPKLILLRDDEGLFIDKEHFINNINEMYSNIYGNNIQLSIVTKVYKIYLYRIHAEKCLSSLPCIKELNSNINEYYYTKINNINHDY